MGELTPGRMPGSMVALNHKKIKLDIVKRMEAYSVIGCTNQWCESCIRGTRMPKCSSSASNRRPLVNKKSGPSDPNMSLPPQKNM
jgi:hypothetical protein